MNSRVVERKSGFRVPAHVRQFALPERGRPRGVVGLKLEPGIAGFFSQRQQPFAKPPGVVYFTSSPSKHPLAPERGKNIRALAQTFAKRLGPGIGLEHFRRSKSSRCYEGGAEPNAQFDFDLGTLDLVSNASNGIERPPQMVDRLFVGAAAQGLGGGALVVRDRARKLVAALKMLRQLGGDRVQLPVQAASSRRPTRAWLRRAARCRQTIVQQLAVEIMPEGVKLRARAIRPCGRSGSER